MRGKSNVRAVRLDIIVKEVTEREIISVLWVIIVQLIRQPQHNIHVQQVTLLKKGDQEVGLIRCSISIKLFKNIA